MISGLAKGLRWRIRRVWLVVLDLPERVESAIAFRRQAHRYRFLTEGELRATRKSDTLFVFGSGASLNAVSASQWQEIGRHDTLGFNWFVRQEFVRCDYHLIREI